MKLSLRTGAAVAMAACIAGCASPGPPAAPAAVVTPLRTRVIPADRAATIAIGRSTRAEVVVALGETLVISFESGFEVWVYRLAADSPARPVPGAARSGLEQEAGSATGEFVVLFGPSGLVARTRIRSASDAHLLRSAPDP
jgi:hypothetical protein